MEDSQGTTPTHPAVLVVDDNLALRTIMSAILREEGYRVLTAEHGGPALDLMRASPEPLLVTLDLIMPDVDGIAVLETVAADETLAQRHAIILVTSAVEVANRGRVQTLRARLGIPLVPKPIAMQQLLDAVTKAEQRLRS